MIFDFSKKELSAKNILEIVSEADIYKYYLGEDISTRRKYSSPFREDKNPSLSFVMMRDGALLWRDWGDSMQTKASGVFRFVQRLFNLNYYEAMAKINEDLGLGLDGISIDPKVIKYKKNNGNIKLKSYANIIVTRRRFTKEDRDFWYNYHISIRTLAKFNVFPVNDVYVEKDGIIKSFGKYRNSSPIYAYRFNSYKGYCYKIYSPLNKKFKWLSNCPPNIIQGYNELIRYNDLLIITKSLKDVMVLSEMGYHSIAPQSETIGINVEIFRDLKARFNKIVLFYDNDETGLRRGDELSKELGISYIFIPQDCNTKDISDYVKANGFDEGKKLMEKMLSYGK